MPTSRPTFEFHIARSVRAKYELEDPLFSITGDVILADFRAVRGLVQKLNAGRESADRISAGRVNAAGLIDEIFHHLFRIYESESDPNVFGKALDRLESMLGQDETRALLLDFTALFPPQDVYLGASTAGTYLKGTTGGRANAEIAVEEMILLYLDNVNPANARLVELFDERYLSDRPLYDDAIGELERFFREEPPFGPLQLDMLALLKAPILLHPDDHDAQLAYIREHYGPWLGPLFIRRILNSGDLIKEDRSAFAAGPGGPPTAVPRYRSAPEGADELALGKSGYRYAAESWKDYEDPERFTEDTNWMPRVVLLAKNCYVWLDQLSKQYGRLIRTLDQVPDEELDKFARWNFNGLWLIGIWERSGASRRIKHLMGNIDAVSSAYSLYDYRIADDLGGEAAFANLNERAMARGIRLASDMVPNHTGIFSQWVLEHPEYFIQSSYPPFPNYCFTGPDLSENPAVQLRIEDGYWSRRDAAVAFQRIDNRTGEIRYIYHGNDGTNMPWNDTAQLDMLRRSVREAVIGKIFEIAGRFSIIRFDAAMTLTKRHFARLWYPEPGSGGDIPSRADHALAKEDFERAFPEEFWREVVDRINAEKPETLLLAEAFWLLEGYFVRTLGMHRVYNSAFMHMMMKEENAKYRSLLSETLEFEPEILKRYVSFMSNPDEETAIRQFGTDDKYFGVCTLLMTLPGLPMIAHGQIEGLTEKYGMEYPRAYYHESPHPGLIERHEREIFPLMKKRFLFSQVANFWLFDVTASDGTVNENVFAFVNRERGERALVLYNNKYERASGRIFRSRSKLVSPAGAPKNLETRTIAEALGLKSSPRHYYLYRDHVSGLEYIRSGSDAARNGFEVDLEAFKYRVFLDWREIEDDGGDWGKLARKLGHRGVGDIQQAFDDLRLEPVHRAFEAAIAAAAEDSDSPGLEAEAYFEALLRTVQDHLHREAETGAAREVFVRGLAGARILCRRDEEEQTPADRPSDSKIRTPAADGCWLHGPADMILFLIGLTTSALARMLPAEGPLRQRNAAAVLRLETPSRKILGRLGRGEFETARALTLWDILVRYADSASVFLDPSVASWDSLLEDEAVRAFLGVNEFEGVRYYSKENFEELLDWLLAFAVLPALPAGPAAEKLLQTAADRRTDLLDRSLRAEYKLDALRRKLASL
jgi:glycosidase